MKLSKKQLINEDKHIKIRLKEYELAFISKENPIPLWQLGKQMLESLNGEKVENIFSLMAIFSLYKNKVKILTELINSYKIEDRKKKIIYFEDDPFLGDIYIIELEKKGYDCVHFEHPPKSKKKLIKIIDSEKPDLIIMDMLMPVMDGFVATACLKSDEKTKNIPIIALTNLGRKEHISKAMDMGMEDYIISTQFTPEETIEKIEAFLNQTET